MLIHQFYKKRRSTFTGLLIFSMICFSSACTKAVLDLDETPIELGEVTFDADIKAIIVTNCTMTCHVGSAPIGGIVLSGYTNVRNQTEFGSVIARINDFDNPMPPSGAMSSEDRQKIQKWADDGYPQN